VAVRVEVEAPAGTPDSPAVHVATSANGWTHQPLSKDPASNIWRGTVMVPRGEWFDYKYTRGDWDTVEKWPGCAEAADRYRFGAASERQSDVVATWRDWCN